MMVHLMTSSLTLALTIIQDWLVIILFLNAYFTDPLSHLALLSFILTPCNLGVLLSTDCLCINRGDPSLDVMDLLQVILTLLSARWVRVRVTDFLLALIITESHHWVLGFRGRGKVWVEILEGGALLHRGSLGWWMIPHRRLLVKMHLFRGFRRLQVGRSHWSLGFFNIKV